MPTRPRCKGPRVVISVLVHATVVDALLRLLDVTDQPTSVDMRELPAS